MGDRKYEALGDGDLTPEQLDGMEMWDRDEMMLTPRLRAVGAMLVRRAVAEIRRHRAAQSASTERVRSVVRTACLEFLMFDDSVESEQIERIATRVASQLAVPVPESHLVRVARDG